jgi:hypothetical protein
VKFNLNAMGMGLLLLGLLVGVPALAQQTVFNAPSADVMPKGETFLQHESQFRPWQPGRFIVNTEYYAYGIGRDIELNATLFNLNAPASDNISLGLGFKKIVPLLSKKLPEREFKLTVGEIVPISLQGDGVGNWTYAHLSGQVPKLKTRLSAGVSTGTRQIFGRTTVGFVGTYEQPITRRFKLQGDWFSGTHALGLFINGFSYSLPGDVVVFGGYQIPNNKRSGQQGFVFEVAKYLK